MRLECALKLLFAIIFGAVCGDNVGWLKYFEENPTEFHDLTLTWEGGNSSSIPSCRSGIYVRNGPAQVSGDPCALI